MAEPLNVLHSFLVSDEWQTTKELVQKLPVVRYQDHVHVHVYVMCYITIHDTCTFHETCTCACVYLILTNSLSLTHLSYCI